MGNVLHKTLSPANNHIVHSFEYADAAARTAATGFISADVGRVARQLSDSTFWVLTSISPVTWVQVGGGGIAFGAGVKAVTFLFRPRGEPADPPAMSAYIVQGPHVTNFVRNGTHSYAPALASPVYEITLDQNYEADEVAVLVWPGQFDNFIANIITNASQDGAWSSAGLDGGVIHLPQVWQTGPAGEKNMRLVIPVTLFLGVGGAVTWGGGHSDPLAIMLVFFDRTKANFRNPPLP